MKKINTSKIGFFQALGVVFYCAFIAGLINLFGKAFPAPTGFFGSVFMLVLLVFSAAFTGSIVFGYPAYLFLNNKQAKEALYILGFTLLYTAIMIWIIAVFIMTVI